MSELTKKARRRTDFDGLVVGLEDALAYAKGRAAL
jgi:hypothetical protein